MRLTIGDDGTKTGDFPGNSEVVTTGKATVLTLQLRGGDAGGIYQLSNMVTVGDPYDFIISAGDTPNLQAGAFATAYNSEASRIYNAVATTDGTSTDTGLGLVTLTARSNSFIPTSELPFGTYFPPTGAPVPSAASFVFATIGQAGEWLFVKNNSDSTLNIELAAKAGIALREAVEDDHSVVVSGNDMVNTPLLLKLPAYDSVVLETTNSSGGSVTYAGADVTFSSTHGTGSASGQFVYVGLLSH